jgi:hypothetical protein
LQNSRQIQHWKTPQQKTQGHPPIGYSVNCGQNDKPQFDIFDHKFVDLRLKLSVIE